MKFVRLIWLIAVFIALAIQPISAQIITGTFDWTGVTNNGEILFDPASGTATFTYDTVQNYGTLSNFYSGFSQFYVFTMVTLNGEDSKLPDPNNLPSNISAPITTFGELTDFSTQSSQIPWIGGTTITETLTNGWLFTGINGQNNGGLDATSWSGNNGMGGDIFDGTISNFQATVAPEPSSFYELVLGLLFLWSMGRPIQQRQQTAIKINRTT